MMARVIKRYRSRSINCNQRNYTAARKPALRLSVWRTLRVADVSRFRNAKNPVSGQLYRAHALSKEVENGGEGTGKKSRSRRCFRANLVQTLF